MAKFFKLIGEGRSPAPEPYDLPYVDFSPGKNPTGYIHIGDELLLYACGGRKRVFATAHVTSEPYPSGRENYPYRVDVAYDVNVNPADGVLLDDVDGGRDLAKSVIVKGSYFGLTDEEFDQAAWLLTKAAEEVSGQA
jgi:hypothetical protein